MSPGAGSACCACALAMPGCRRRRPRDEAPVLTGRRGLLVLAIVFGLAVALGASLTRVAGLGPWATARELPRATRLPSLEEAGPWGRGRWTADSLRGHVTVVMLWSDTDP